MSELESHRPADCGTPSEPSGQAETENAPVTPAPERDDGFQSIDPRHCTLERILGGIFGAIVLGTVAITSLSMALGFELTGWGWLVVYAASMALAACVLVLKLVWPGIEFRHIAWRLNEDGLEIRRGVLSRHQISVPLARVQHADVFQGPLQRAYGLATLKIHTAGTLNATVSLDGLSHVQAVELRDRLVRQGKERDVV